MKKTRDSDWLADWLTDWVSEWQRVIPAKYSFLSLFEIREHIHTQHNNQQNKLNANFGE